MDALKLELGNMCQNACSISIIPDGWTHPNVKLEFLAIAALLINESFEKQLLVIGMEVLNDGHSAESTKKIIEDIINEYKFEKSKIRGFKYFRQNFFKI